MTTFFRRTVWSLLWAGTLTAACGRTGYSTDPDVQDSAQGGVSTLVSVSLNVGSGSVFVPIYPHCVVMQAGNTVEFRNYAPDRPARIESLAGPRSLRSPSLQAPYNYVGSQDPFGGGAPCVPQNANCKERVAHTFWRTTLTEAGIYDWVNAATSPTVHLVSLSDGTAAFVPSDGSLPLGTVCVTDAAGAGCAGVCCTRDSDCSGLARCVPLPLADNGAAGRCLVPAL